MKAEIVKSNVTDMTNETESTGCVNKDHLSLQKNKLSKTNNPTIQNFVLVWLDAKIDESVEDYKNSFHHLRRIVTSINTFTNIEECFNYINQIRTQKVLMLVSGSIAHKIIEKIDATVQIESVYIFCKNKKFHLEWALNFQKIKGVHTEIEPICQALLVDRQDCDQSMISISYNGLDAMFMYTKLMKNIVMGVDDETAKSVREFVEYCRKQGKIDEEQIDEVESQYFDHPPIWWYTRETFIYSMLNRSLKQMNVEVIQKMGFFIRDLHLDINRLYREVHMNTDKNLFILYRGQGLQTEAFAKMKQARGGLMTFNNFLSTSRSYSMALERFARPKSYPKNSFGIVFRMIIDPQLCKDSNISYGSVSHEGAFANKEEEILFITHTVFRIEKIEPIENSDNDRLFQVTIRLVGDEDHEFYELTASITEEVERRTTRGWSRFGFILIKLNEPQGAELIYRQLLDNTNDLEQKAEYLHYLGFTYDIRSEWSLALQYYNQALQIRTDILHQDNLDLVSSYNNIGNVYGNMGEYSQALVYHEKSLAIRTASLDENHPDLANSYNNMAGVYFSMREYSKALEYFQKSVDIRLKSLSNNDPDLAASYHNIGSVYKNMGNYAVALRFYEDSLKIREKSLPSNHSDLAASNNNIGNLFNTIGEYQKALQYYERSIAIWEKYYSENHSDMAACYSNMGHCFQNMREYTKALQCFRKALEIYQATLSMEDLKISQLQENIQRIHQKKNKCPIS